MGGGASIDETLSKETFVEQDSGTLSQQTITPNIVETVRMIVRISSARLTQEASSLEPLPSMLSKAQSMKLLAGNQSENDEILFYAKDLFFEVAGDASAIEMSVFEMLLDEVLFHITLNMKRLKPSSRKELSDSLLNRLTNELGLTTIEWKNVEALFGSICDSVVRYSQLFDS